MQRTSTEAGGLRGACPLEEVTGESHNVNGTLNTFQSERRKNVQKEHQEGEVVLEQHWLLKGRCMPVSSSSSQGAMTVFGIRDVDLACPGGQCQHGGENRNGCKSVKA
jgi:hypothetical protein